jgi:tetraacyldisaccharide 4'-kinase
MIPPSPTPPRSPWQLFYGAAHRLRRAWYRRQARRLPRPVLSVGNLHWGGTGKTPLVAAVAGHLRDRGRKVAILSRGYKSQGDGVRLVSNFQGGPFLGPSTAGDEPVLLAGLLPGVAVVVGPDRFAAGRAALERLDPQPDLFLLDDGFSHLALARDLDLLAFPAADPFGGGRLPPAGRLREPLAAVARADAVLLTGLGVTLEDAAALFQALRRHGFAGSAFAAPTHVLPPLGPDRRPLHPAATCLLVSGIARPERFRQAVAALGLDIAGELSFPDHHDYPAESLEQIRTAFREHGAHVVLATAKDTVKLRSRLDLPLAELAIEACPERSFFPWLEGRLAELRAQAGEGSP